jgi:hypothetical protein
MLLQMVLQLRDSVEGWRRVWMNVMGLGCRLLEDRLEVADDDQKAAELATRPGKFQEHGPVHGFLFSGHS